MMAIQKTLKQNIHDIVIWQTILHQIFFILFNQSNVGFLNCFIIGNIRAQETKMEMMILKHLIWTGLEIFLGLARFLVWGYRQRFLLTKAKAACMDGISWQSYKNTPGNVF